MEKLYIVKSRKMILGLDLMGPLTTPTHIDEHDVLNMVNRGYDIWAVNPKDHSEQIKLTSHNVRRVTFSNSRAAGVRQKKINRDFQDLDKPVVVSVVKNEEETFTVTKQNDKPKKEEKKKEEHKEEKITSPDAFEKK